MVVVPGHESLQEFAVGSDLGSKLVALIPERWADVLT